LNLIIKNRSSDGRIAGTKSLYEYCTENKRQDILDLWDYKLNDATPKDISFSTTQEYYFLCSKGLHKSELKRITYLTNSKSVKCIACNSAAQWLIDTFGDGAVERYWDFSKNIYDPWTLPKMSNKTVWIKCQEKEYHGSYEILLSGFVMSEHKCPYCDMKRVHPLDSLGSVYSESLRYWSSANFLTPFDYSPKSNSTCAWKCKNHLHKEYYRSPKEEVKAGFECPICSTMKTTSSYQEKFENYMRNSYPNYSVLHEFNCNIIPINPKTNRKLRFDNEIVELRLIVEINGLQHYEITGFHELRARQTGESPSECFEYERWVENFKKNTAIKCGYEYLSIPYTEFKNDEYKNTIDSCIREICERRKCIG